MKIIAGTLGGRRFNAPRGNRTHPMSDKIRGALFNSLGDISGVTVLDAFGGSGAVAFEAISRGAIFATMIDTDKKAYFTMKENAAILEVNEKCKIIRANVSSWSDNNTEQLFDIVLLDPPFDKLKVALLNKLSRHLAKNGRLIVSLGGKQTPLSLDGMQLTDQKKYGDAQLLFYKSAA
jgi:16S rRNA (guanine966-N2)-methyltransferase